VQHNERPHHGLQHAADNFAVRQHVEIVIEGTYAVCGDQLHVRDHEGRSWTVVLKPGDNAEILARKLLREKFGKHHAFNQPIHYPRWSAFGKTGH
jgi:hypothetical protein